MHFQAALRLATKWVDAMWRYAFKHLTDNGNDITCLNIPSTVLCRDTIFD